jgi:arginine deiminase
MRPTTGTEAVELHVGSEVGRLRDVVLHRPGAEMDRLTPTNHDELLFDDLPDPERMREEHDAFAEQLREHGVDVHYFADLLTEALEADEARIEVVTHLARGGRFGEGMATPFADLVRTADAAQLATYLIGGLQARDLETAAAHRSLVLAQSGPEGFLLPPLPNHLFQRDATALVYDAVAISPMAKPARWRETLNARVVYGHHPLFAGAQRLAVDAAAQRGTGEVSESRVEGGDVLVLGHRAVMVGIGERSTASGVESLATALFAADQADTVIAVELPRTRAFMHLDTVMTMVDRDAFSVYPHLPQELRSFTLRRIGDGTAFKVEENRGLFPVIAEVLGLEQVRVLRAPLEPAVAEREQWHDGNNLLALAPGVVVAYQRNRRTNDYLTDQGIEVVAVSGDELGRGRGGPRCMTCPIRRDAIA